MAPPNTLRLPENAEAHANFTFQEIMDFLTVNVGVLDFVGPDGRGGAFKHNPLLGRLSTGFERADIAGTVTGAATATTSANKNEKAVRLWRTLFHEYFKTTMERVGKTPESYAADIGEQAGILAGIKILVDIYNSNIAAATSVVDDHSHDVYVDDLDATDQVDMIPSVVQAAKFLLGDHMDRLDVAVCNSKQWNDYTTHFITSASIFNVPNVVGEVIRGGMFRDSQGMIWIVDDQIPTAAGPTTTSPTKQRALLFRSRTKSMGGMAPVQVQLEKPLELDGQHVLGAQSRKNQLQWNLNYYLKILGKQWDETNGQENPTDANLALSTNWDDSFDDARRHGSIVLTTN